VESAAENFGNGRGVRNVFEAICRIKDSRVAAMMRSGQPLSDEDLIRITAEDIELKLKETEEKQHGYGRNIIGFAGKDTTVAGGNAGDGTK
jgi:hypothetical protein